MVFWLLFIVVQASFTRSFCVASTDYQRFLATSCHVLALLWHDAASTVKQKIAPNGLQKLGKVAKTQQTHNRQWSSNSISLFRYFARKTDHLHFGSNFSSIQTTHITLWLTVDEASALSLINLATRKNCHQ